MPRDMGGYVIISYAEIPSASYNFLALLTIYKRPRSVPIDWYSFIYYKNTVKHRVEKYFFDTPTAAKTVDISIFIDSLSKNPTKCLYFKKVAIVNLN